MAKFHIIPEQRGKNNLESIASAFIKQPMLKLHKYVNHTIDHNLQNNLKDEILTPL